MQRRPIDQEERFTSRLPNSAPESPVDSLFTLTVNEVPEPSFALTTVVFVLAMIVLRMRRSAL